MQTSKKKPIHSHKKTHTGKMITRVAFLLPAFFIFMALGCFFFYARERVTHPVPTIISAEMQEEARSVYFNTTERAGLSYLSAPDLESYTWNGALTSPIPSVQALSADLNARSAIIVDATTGAIIFEKNADERIPPASMTKLVAMYTAFHAAENGEITFDDVVALPKESWAVNIPSGSSLMFLGEGQTVTVRELLLGMAVASGNDAAIALAIHVSGSVEAFITRMNTEMQTLGLEQTRFVEPSGLSEYNMTTAREFADFALVYIRDYPQALRAFHAQPSIAYPMPWNVKESSSEIPIRQNATNKLLGALNGCDGLKTGFINESGYNLSLTAERNGSRFISVTMGGSGNGAYEGNLLRSHDGVSLMEWSFSNFKTVRPQPIKPVALAVWGGSQNSLIAIPATSSAFTAPNDISGIDKNGLALEQEIHLSRSVSAPLEAGTVIGSVSYSIKGTLIHSVPLIADRSIEKGNAVHRIIDSLSALVAPLVTNARYE